MMAPVGWVVILLAAQVPPPALAQAPARGLLEERQAIRLDEAARLKALADRLSRDGQEAAAKEVRGTLEPATATEGPTRFVPLAEVVLPSAGGLANLPANRQTAEPWRSELRASRDAAARSLFALSERAMSAETKHFALADECLRAVLRRQPDHAEARRLLGYVAYKGGWATPFAARMIREGMIDHPKFGWVPAAWEPHLERGELPAPLGRGQKSPRWLPAQEADALHSAWENRWRIDTEHFQIQTNVPLSEAITFGRHLEAFHDLFFSLLADLLSSDNRLPLAQRFRDKTLIGDRTTARHQVYYFKTKQEYVDYLVPIEPAIGGSLGIYIPPRPGKGKRAPAYFFRDPGGQIDASATLFHEVSHQLLFESAGPNAYDRNVGNYWVFEGLGTYFETVLVEPDGSLLVGGLVGPRIQEARRRVLDDGDFVPIEELVRLGKSAYNDDDVVHLHYAESMALTVFLMQAQGRAYREGFLDYVKDAYRGRLKRDSGKSLQERLGVPYSTLDRQFLAYLRER